MESRHMNTWLEEKLMPRLLGPNDNEDYEDWDAEGFDEDFEEDDDEDQDEDTDDEDWDEDEDWLDDNDEEIEE
jgi:hypothetical protein